jgi:hypothetical protein
MTHSLTDFTPLQSEAFNANRMTSREVAEGYIDARHLETIAAPDNVVLTGPRGSGKTTLFKMLTREALDKWADPLADRLTAADFLSIYIGSDIVNRSQYEAAHIEVPKSRRRMLEHAADINFTLHLAKAIHQAVRYEMTRGRARLEASDAAELVKRLAHDWSIKPEVNHFDALGDALDDAISDCSKAVHQAAFGHTEQLRAITKLYAIASMATMIDKARNCLCETVIGLPRRWMLLFDDIEFVPDVARQAIISLNRQLPNGVEVKLALTPLSHTTSYLDGNSAASAFYSGHDFRSVSLGFQDTNHIKDFTEDLHAAFISRLTGGRLDLSGDDIPAWFAPPSGRSDPILDSDLDESTGERFNYPHELIAKLIDSQPRFSAYAAKNSIDSIDNFRSLSKSARASRLRQALPIIRLWNEVLANPEARNAKRSRKERATREFYCHYPSFQTLADGNPRINLIMIDSLLRDHVTNHPNWEKPPFSAQSQSSAMWVALTAQENLTNSVLSRYPTAFFNQSPLLLLDQVTRYLFNAVYFGKAFPANPPNSFEVDFKMDDDLGAALVDMVYTGALVDLTGEDESNPGSFLNPESELLHRVFRPSFLICSDNWLPLRRGRSVKLSTILRSAAAPRRLHPSAVLALHAGEQGTIF